MTNISGTNIAAGIAPFTTDDTYATHQDIYGKGGYRCVNTIAERDAIPAPRQSIGMLVFVAEDNTTYKLKADLTWEIPPTGTIYTEGTGIDISGTSIAVDKIELGLDNVDNTSDANKPISLATQNALSLKSNDNDVVHLIGNETIAGDKTFTQNISAGTLLLKGKARVDATYTSLNRHSIEDYSILNIATPDSVNGYSSFDAYPTINNSADINHFNGYQSRLNCTGSNKIATVMNYNAQLNFNGSGDITQYQAFRVYAPAKTGSGTIDTAVGLYIDSITQATTNWAINTAGTTPSYFGGNVGIGQSNPTYKLDVLGSIRGIGDFLISNSTVLGSSVGNSYLISSFTGNSNTNIVKHNEWLLRDANSTTWTSARLHDAISVDSSFASPGSNTRTWWERDPNDDIQSWGTGGSTYLTIKASKIGVGSSIPAATFTVLKNAANSTFGAEQAGILLQAADSGNYQRLGFFVDGTNNYSSIQASQTNIAHNILALNPAGGNVGIGTTSPEQKLHISSTGDIYNVIQSTDYNKSGIRLQRGAWATDNYNDWEMLNSGGKLYFNTHSNGNALTAFTLDTIGQNGNAVFSGTVTASNFTGSSSGTNTGDQDLSALATKANTYTKAQVDAAIAGVSGSSVTNDYVIAMSIAL